MKILVLENLFFEDLDQIKNKLESYYLSKNEEYESKLLEFSLIKTVGTSINDNFYLWLNDSVIIIKNYDFKDLKISDDIKLNFVQSFPYNGVFDKIYLKFFKKPKGSYDTYYIPLTFSLNLSYYKKTFISFYDFLSGQYSYDKFEFSMNDMERYYLASHEGKVFWRKSDNYYMIARDDRVTKYIEFDLKTGKTLKIDENINTDFIDKFIKEKYNDTQYSIIALGKVSKIYLSTGKVITIDFSSAKVVKEEKVMSVNDILKKIKTTYSLNKIKHYALYEDKIYVDLENDERELLIIMAINGKVKKTYQILKEKGVKNIIDFKKFSEVKIKRTQYPVLEDEYVPGYYDIVAYDHDFQLTYRIFDDGTYELISKQILIATAIEICEKYLKDVKFIKFPVFKKDESEFNAATNSWILTFSGRNVDYTLKVFVKDNKIEVETLKIKTSAERIEYLFKKVLNFKVVNISSRKHLFSGEEIWVVKYKDNDGNIKIMKLSSEDDILKYYKKGSL